MSIWSLSHMTSLFIARQTRLSDGDVVWSFILTAISSRHGVVPDDTIQYMYLFYLDTAVYHIHLRLE